MFFRKKWALVLSGGGAKGFAHIGVLKFLDDAGIRPDMIVGTSVGAIMGGFYACGMTGREIEKFIVSDFEFKPYFDIKSLQLPNFSITKAIVVGESLKNFLSKHGVDSGTKLHMKIAEMTKNKSFGEEQIPFVCNSVDLLNHRHVIHHEGKIADAIRASMSVPGFFHPFKINDSFLVDGGIFDNMPVSIPRKLGIKKVIAVNLNGHEPENIDKFNSGMDVIIEALFIGSRINETLENNKPDIEILASDGRTNIDMSNPEVSIEYGYKKAKEVQDQIFDITTPVIKKLFSKKPSV